MATTPATTLSGATLILIAQMPHMEAVEDLVLGYLISDNEADSLNRLTDTIPIIMVRFAKLVHILAEKFPNGSTSDEDWAANNVVLADVADARDYFASIAPPMFPLPATKVRPFRTCGPLEMYYQRSSDSNPRRLRRYAPTVLRPIESRRQRCARLDRMVMNDQLAEFGSLTSL